MDGIRLFKNRTNEEIKTTDGRTFWISRSIAVVGVIMFDFPDKMLVLTQRRSGNMDAPHKMALVSGYLDWNETGYECLVREIYEETSLYVPDFEKFLNWDNDREPFYVNTEPDENRQNITLNYVLNYEFDEDEPELIKLLDIEKFTCDEVDEIKLMNIEDMGKYQWAFNHDERVRQAITLKD